MNHHAHIGEVPGLHHPVSSQYADGLFTQHPNSSGQVYNVSKELREPPSLASSPGQGEGSGDEATTPVMRVI